MTTDEKLELVDAVLFPGEPMNEEEKVKATELLEMPPAGIFSGSYAPSFVARRIQMYRAAEKSRELNAK